MTSPDPLPTIAFFGSTGGCTLHCLVLALQAGYKCNAIVRTPEKLTTLLAPYNLPAPALKNLHIIQGSATDAAAVRTTLLAPDQTRGPSAPKTVDLIISGIGSKPNFSNLLHPTLENPTVCQDGMRTLLATLQALQNENEVHGKPKLAVISTTGVDSKRDVPVMMLPLYNWMLKVPHADKKAMEAMILADAALGAGRALASYLVVRPSFLVEGKDKKVRVGTEEEPAVGYGISRSEVGRWIFENAVLAFDGPVQVKEKVKGMGTGWAGGYWGRLVSITW
ncbi:NAD(P)-dependent oxidoreductase [Aspergillus brunneoviolaceus CBS 621.78]|uniref:Uncharacterized protein n=1 Tax=Aspergillus brunneoviolaceus CBS 621.78 TaxID=1450534 RepID=A0ACD1FY20_9EURO|nr:hypothetical protein BO95DRAFT_505678 [Aspergillus brunneoviolaceus CBS 621.78]RAH41838.1 hypothetical protein BO95DRAFT_505678 [Aspergillus brunneoviolaceus CBS 621.78]